MAKPAIALRIRRTLIVLGQGGELREIIRLPKDTYRRSANIAYSFYGKDRTLNTYALFLDGNPYAFKGKPIELGHKVLSILLELDLITNEWPEFACSKTYVISDAGRALIEATNMDVIDAVKQL